MSAPWGGDPKRPRARRASQLSGQVPIKRSGSGKDRNCCAMVAAARAARAGRWRLSRRYAVWSVRFLAARAVTR